MDSLFNNLLFQVNITSGSITCFIFCSQLIVITLDRVFDGDDPYISGIIYAASDHSIIKWFFNIIIINLASMMCGIFNSFVKCYPHFALVVN